MNVVWLEKMRSPQPCVACAALHGFLPQQCDTFAQENWYYFGLITAGSQGNTDVWPGRASQDGAARVEGGQDRRPRLLGDVLDVQVAPPVLRHRLDGRELRQAAVVVGRGQLRHREADDAQGLAHCAAGQHQPSALHRAEALMLRDVRAGGVFCTAMMCADGAGWVRCT